MSDAGNNAVRTLDKKSRALASNDDGTHHAAHLVLLLILGRVGIFCDFLLILRTFCTRSLERISKSAEKCTHKHTTSSPPPTGYIWSGRPTTETSETTGRVQGVTYVHRLPL
jgi:hypothetical protein